MDWCIIVLLVFLAWLDRLPPKKDENARKSNAIIYPYRTINAIDGSGVLLPYEFHKNGETNGCMEFSAIIKKMDPAKDDYKTYCRSVIEDIAKTAETNSIIIDIYDDYEAYEYLEAGLDQAFVSLTQSEVDTLEKHLVAVYHGNIGYYDDNYVVAYYQDAQNKYTENETFEPKSGE